MSSTTHTNFNERPEPVRETEHEPVAQSVAAAPLPSERVPPTRVDSIPQQASTQPGDGSEVHQGTSQAPFKEQVIGVSKKARGTLLGKPELKEEGQRILDGEKSYWDEKKQS